MVFLHVSTLQAWESGNSFCDGNGRSHRPIYLEIQDPADRVQNFNPKDQWVALGYVAGRVR